eukprot:CAMPEP_0113241750 /NCGR_PEP_ID=MMETSP0008_2-20120614/6961_1 /TAXON_ID=97485 /ORGANISM="Prymnesium parvum" /LENGTH=476 /DNA_ID=CAMNT_0000089175 /DNA_START=353 /DNA_END=1783 /DNA_ORIENTATION=- /assembly_acc=CAM_ASM_000153
MSTDPVQLCEVRTLPLDLTPIEYVAHMDGMSVRQGLLSGHAARELFQYCSFAVNTSRVCIGMAMASLCCKNGVMDAAIHFLKVRQECQRRGLGQKLYDSMRQEVFEKAQELRGLMCIRGVHAIGEMVWTAHLQGCRLGLVQSALLLCLNGHMVRDVESGDWLTAASIRKLCVIQEEDGPVHKNVQVLPKQESIEVPFALTRQQRWKCKLASSASLPDLELGQAMTWEKYLQLNQQVAHGEMTSGSRISIITSTHVKLPSPLHDGVLSFVLPAQPCRMVRDYLEDERNFKIITGKGSFLQQYKVLCVGSQELTGYNSYELVHGEHHPGKQASRSFQARKKSSIRETLLHLPGLSHIYKMLVETLFGEHPVNQNQTQWLRAIHFLRVDHTNQVAFKWHTDAVDFHLPDNELGRLVTIVVQLSADAPTAMQMYLCAPQPYMGSGAAIAFHGAAIHRTIPWEEGHECSLHIWKVVFFLIC